MFSERNELVITLVIFIHFLDSVWKLHALFICSVYGIEETTSVEKTSIIIFLLKRNNCVLKTLYIVFIIVR